MTYNQYGQERQSVVRREFIEEFLNKLLLEGLLEKAYYMDMYYIGLGLVFFAASWVLVKFFGHIQGGK